MNNLFDLGLKRTGLQATGFYFFYLVLFFIIALICGLIVGVGYFAFSSLDLTKAENVAKLMATCTMMGIAMAVIVSLSMSLAILNKKGYMNNPLYILISIVFAGLAILLGALIGLVPAAFFTTLPNKRNPSLEQPMTQDIV